MRLRWDKKFNQFSNDARSHLALPSTLGLKGAIITFTLLFVDFFGAFILIADPFIESVLWLTYPLIILYNIWFIFLLFRNVYSIQMESLLYIAVTCLLSVYIYLFIVYKIAYFTLGFESPLFMVLVLCSVILEAGCFSVYYHRRLLLASKKQQDGTREGLKEKIANYVLSSIYTIPAAGYIFYHSIIKQNGFINYALLFCYLFFIAVLTFLGTKNAHKYIILKVNSHLIIFENPSKREWKEMRKKGKEIIIK